MLDHINGKLLPVMRDANVTLRWLVLHRTSQIKRVRDNVVPATSPEEV